MRELVPPKLLATYDAIVRAAEAGEALDNVMWPAYKPAEPPPKLLPSTHRGDAPAAVAEAMPCGVPAWLNLRNASAHTANDHVVHEPSCSALVRPHCGESTLRAHTASSVDDDCTIA